MKLAIRSYYIWMIVFFAVVFILIVNFVVPKDISGDVEIMSGDVYMAMDQQIKEDETKMKLDLGIESEAIMLGTRDEIIVAMEENRSSTGLYIFVENDEVVFEYILQGFEGENTREMLKLSTLSRIARDQGQLVDTSTTYLKGKHADKISLIDLITPIFIVTESALMGLFLVAAYLFMDKNEGSIRAFSVTPNRIWVYLLSKVAMFITFSVASGVLVMLFVKGLQINYFYYIALLIVYSAFGTLIGLLIAAFFDNIQGAMVWILVVATMFAVTTTSYVSPSFSPTAIKLIPTYPMLFAMKAVIYETGNVSYIIKNMIGFLMADGMLLGLTSMIYKRRLWSF